MKQLKTVDITAWSSGQMSSKIWMCEELEIFLPEENSVWIYGSWYGLLASTLLIRARKKFLSISLFDLDPDANEIANSLNKNWSLENGIVQSYKIDCNELNPNEWEKFSKRKPNVFINTSCEHVEGTQWFDKIPSGSVVALQTSNHDFSPHFCKINDGHEFEKKFPLKKILYLGKKDYAYLGSYSFTRFMMIGVV